MTCFSRQSGCTRLRLDTFRVSPSPNGNHCAARGCPRASRRRRAKTCPITSPKRGSKRQRGCSSTPTSLSRRSAHIFAFRHRATSRALSRNLRGAPLPTIAIRYAHDDRRIRAALRRGLCSAIAVIRRFRR